MVLGTSLPHTFCFHLVFKHLTIDNTNATLSFPSNDFVGLLVYLGSIIEDMWSKITLGLLKQRAWVIGSVYVNLVQYFFQFKS